MLCLHKLWVDLREIQQTLHFTLEMAFKYGDYLVYIASLAASLEAVVEVHVH